MRTARTQHIFLPVLLGLVGLAWLSLVFWSHSDHHRYLDHHALEEIGAGRSSSLLLVFVAGWTLMTIAMMLPTSLPLVTRFQRMTTSRSDGARLVWLLVGGYLLVWTAFGFLAYLVDLGVHQFVHHVALIERNEWAISASVLFLAGIFQFTPLKYRCLEKCRSPLTFIAERWHGRNPHRDALHIGIDHGLFCVGCCWTLMLLMFLVGAGSLFWMLVLGIAMGLEKNVAWGRRLSAPLGIILVSAGCSVSLLAVT